MWVSKPHFGKLGVTHDFSWWLVGKPMVDFLFALCELFSLSITVPELWGEMCTARLFSQGLDLFALKVYLDRVVPSTILGVRKVKALCYPTVKTAFLFRFDTIPECDEQTTVSAACLPGCHAVYLFPVCVPMYLWKANKWWWWRWWWWQTDGQADRQMDLP